MMSPSGLHQAIRVIDSHTAGEPTRIIYQGGPDLGKGELSERVEKFRQEYDFIRSGVVNEPRGSHVLVGGLICEPRDSSCSVGVIFFNNIGYLGMCGHGLIGLLTTLHHLERISPGIHRVETPVGIVSAELKAGGEITFENVPSYRFRASVELDIPEYGLVVGDIAWGGNWFFLVHQIDVQLQICKVAQLTRFASAIREELTRQRISGAEGAMIDHIELFSNAIDPTNHSRSFVLCPGGAYDRSPCGTGTSAKLSCLAAEGKLPPGQSWRQESIIGTVFTASYRHSLQPDLAPPSADGPVVIPSITGRAHICAESTLRFDPLDPFVWGIVS